MDKKKSSESRDRPFPWLCADCCTRTVVPTVIDHTAKVKHDGVVYELHLPGIEIPRCQTCGEIYPTVAVDDQVSDALRQRLRLLLPAQIQNEIKRIGLKKKQLAERLGVEPETISRWANGALIQSRAMDNLMRLYFADPAMADQVLCGAGQAERKGIL